MGVIVCPGIHPREFTRDFLNSLDRPLRQVAVFPTDRYPAYSVWDTYQFVQTQAHDNAMDSVLFLGFSAGVVGAIGAALQWQWDGGTVKALIALDGWGVPLYGSFPMHRLSHDHFTHWSSALLGGGEPSFYADPAVTHLNLWRFPQTVRGYWVSSDYSKVREKVQWQEGYDPGKQGVTTAAQFLDRLFAYYNEV